MSRFLCRLGLHRWTVIDWGNRFPGFEMMAVPYRSKCRRCGETK